MRKELLRMLHSIWFVLGIVFTLALCFFSEVVISNGLEYTIPQVLENMSRSEMTQNPQLTTAVVLQRGFSGHVTLFVPIVAALPMLQLLYTEACSGFKRLYMGRKSHRGYYWNKWVAGMLTGGLTLFLAAVLFHVFKILTIPEVDAELLEMMGYDTEHMYLEVIKSYIGIFAYGASVTQ